MNLSRKKSDMAIVNPTDLKVGDNVSFTSINPRDSVTWTGEIIALGKYNAVKNIEDLIPYYNEVKKVLPSMEPYTELTYIVLNYYQDGKTNEKVFALPWLNPSSIKILDTNKYFYIKIYDRDTTEVQGVLDLLTSHEYKCSWVKNI